MNLVTNDLAWTIFSAWDKTLNARLYLWDCNYQLDKSKWEFNRKIEYQFNETVKF